MRLPVYLNEDKDHEIYEFFKSLPNFSNWVRECARKEIEAKRHKETQNGLEANIALSELIERQVERLLESRLSGKVLTDTKPEVERVEEGFNIDTEIEENILDDIGDYM